MKAKIIFLIIILLLIASIAFGFYWHFNQRPPTPVSKPQKPTVSVIPVKTLSWRPKIKTFGTVATHSGVTVSAETSGRITGIYFSPQAHVHKGQLLFQLNNDTQTAALAAAKAKLKLSHNSYQRAVKLIKKGVISQMDFETTEKDYHNDQAGVQQALADLQLTQVRAPIAGLIGLNQKKIGDYVNSGDALSTIETKAGFRVDFSVPAQYAKQLRIGQTVLVHDLDQPKITYKARLTQKNNNIDYDTQSIMTWAYLNSATQLLPGQAVAVTIPHGKKAQAIKLPQTCLQYNLGKNVVYKIIAGKAVSTPVTVLQRNSASVIVTGQLKNGDHIVIKGIFKLHDGMPVTIVGNQTK